MGENDDRELKDILEENRDLIAERNLEELYKVVASENVTLVSDLTNILLDFGCNPLIYLTKIPD